MRAKVRDFLNKNGFMILVVMSASTVLSGFFHDDTLAIYIFTACTVMLTGMDILVEKIITHNKHTTSGDAQ